MATTRPSQAAPATITERVRVALAGTAIATLATYRRRGAVLLIAVWYEWADGGLNVCVPPQGAAARNLRHDPRASVLIANSEPPYWGLEYRAWAHLRPASAALLGRLAVRYLGDDRARRYLEGHAPSLWVRLEGGVLRSWDHAPAAAG